MSISIRSTLSRAAVAMSSPLFRVGAPALSRFPEGILTRIPYRASSSEPAQKKERHYSHGKDSHNYDGMFFDNLQILGFTVGMTVVGFVTAKTIISFEDSTRRDRLDAEIARLDAEMDRLDRIYPVSSSGIKANKPLPLTIDEVAIALRVPPSMIREVKITSINNYEVIFEGSFSGFEHMEKLSKELRKEGINNSFYAWEHSSAFTPELTIYGRDAEGFARFVKKKNEIA